MGKELTVGAGKVYDVTEFLDGESCNIVSSRARLSLPAVSCRPPGYVYALSNCVDTLMSVSGGSKIILKYAGKDAT